MLQLFCDKNIMFERKKTVTDKPWETCYITKVFRHSKIQDSKGFERNNKKFFFRKFVTEKLITDVQQPLTDVFQNSFS